MPGPLSWMLFAFSFVITSFNNLPAARNLGHLPVVPEKKIVLTEDRRGLLTRVNFEDSISQLYHQIDMAPYGLDYEVFRLGMVGYYSLRHKGTLNDKKIISIIDFSKPSTEKRFYTIDLTDMKVVYHTYVAHGRNTGGNMATEFSNIPHSNQSSLGFYVTGETYVGSKGFSLRLDGVEKNYNGNMRSRAVVMHEADYVSDYWIERYGRLGRSQGCPALPKSISRDVINTIKDHTVIFAYYPDEQYLTSSSYLNVNELMDVLDATVTGLAAQ